MLQEIPLTLIVYYPHIAVSPTKIDFGIVFIGNTKKSLLTLKNLLSIFLNNLYKMQKNDQFIIYLGVPGLFEVRGLMYPDITIEPVNGILPKSGDISLEVSFSPR